MRSASSGTAPAGGAIHGFLDTWHESATTALGIFWTALWAFGFGYLASAMIQVLVSRQRMHDTMGEEGPRSVALGGVFGFISSSCSFAALSGTRALFTKGAGLVPALAFLLASTNLVIELGIIISIFLGWQFVVGEYLGGVLLILFMWGLVAATRAFAPVDAARERARAEDGDEGDDVPDWRELVASKEGWHRIGMRYLMEWGMVWKDVTVGFTIAGVVAAFVPRSFFDALFVGGDNPSVLALIAQAVVGPIAAFFTFIGSMGNIPLAAVLYGNGVAFAGIMAFIFSDLIVFPVLRVNAKYYGWPMALYIAGVFLVALVATALLLHAGFAAVGLLPSRDAVTSITDQSYFTVDYTLFLNVGFLALSAVFLAWKAATVGIEFSRSEGVIERILFWAALASYVWLAGGLLAGAA